MNTIRSWFGTLVLLTIGGLVGCADSGPKSYQVSGSATLDGQPIPYGEVIFTPDAGQQNSGPQGIAEVRDGKFNTKSGNGKGIAGGPTVIRVNGMSGPGGKTLCEYDLKVDLPRENTTYDIEVPKTAATKPGKEI